MNTRPFWWKNTVIYELYVDKFAGDFEQLTTKLDYFNKLGVGCLWILPHYPSPMVDDGYDISDFKNIREELGALDNFKLFVEKAHDSGLKVITDLVLNHTSSEHLWFREARSSKENPKRDYYLWSDTGKEFPLAPNPFSNIKPQNWIHNPQTDDYYYATFYPQQPDLNWDNPKVFEEMIGVIDFWLDLGVDGFRLDAIPRLVKREGTNCIGLPETHAILKKIRKHIDGNYQDRTLLAETDQPPTEAIKYFGDGDECHMAFHFLLAMKTWLSIKKNSPEIIRGVVGETYKIPDNCQWGTFLTNHDQFALYVLNDTEKKELASLLDPECKFSFKLGSKVSMRMAEVLDGDEEKILKAFKILFNLQGTPVIYYGEEIGMRNAPLEKKPRDTRRYVRARFNWKEAERQMKDPNSIFNNVAKMIAGTRS